VPEPASSHLADPAGYDAAIWLVSGFLAQFTELGEVVGGEQGQRVVTEACYLLAQRGLRFA